MRAAINKARDCRGVHAIVHLEFIENMHEGCHGLLL